jgi:peptidoglycan/LPS O-acetylase OafA/YrhL
MGSLRTIFAISVVLTHCWPKPLFVGGRNAVQLFYIISGFLISYVIAEKNAYPQVGTFYLNRYLRLYPIYAVVALLTILLAIAGGPIPEHSDVFGVFKASPTAGKILLLFSNSFLFTQDWVMFSGIHNGVLGFTSDFQNSDVILYRGLLVPQAWTLGVELSFYLVAPFVLRARKLIYSLLGASVLLRLYVLHLGIGIRDPWTYRFFPTELAFFLLGALAHQILLPIYRRRFATQLPVLAGIATSLLIGFSLCYAVLPIKEPLKAAILFTAFLALIPLAFVFQSSNRVDKWIGNLSYAIYIDHMLVMAIVAYAVDLLKPYMSLDPAVTLCVGSIVGAIIAAILLNHFIAEPVEVLRNRLKHRGRPGSYGPRADPRNLQASEDV